MQLGIALKTHSADSLCPSQNNAGNFLFACIVHFSHRIADSGVYLYSRKGKVSSRAVVGSK